MTTQKDSEMGETGYYYSTNEEQFWEHNGPFDTRETAAQEGWDDYAEDIYTGQKSPIYLIDLMFNESSFAEHVSESLGDLVGYELSEQYELPRDFLEKFSAFVKENWPDPLPVWEVINVEYHPFPGDEDDETTS